MGHREGGRWNIRIGQWRALANVGLVVGVLSLGGFGLVEVSKRQWGWQETFAVRSGSPTSAAWRRGQVRLQGTRRGVVEVIHRRPRARQWGWSCGWTAASAMVRADMTARIISEGGRGEGRRDRPGPPGRPCPRPA
ncbi:MAG: hypothetical protein U0790_27985 [Isosphaeraceae bacterium]